MTLGLQVAWLLVLQSAGRVYCMDGDARGSFPRTAPVLPAGMRASAVLYSPQILLLVYLRILLQPLRRGRSSVDRALQLLYFDGRGYFIGLFALVWIANRYMSIYNRLRLDIKQEQVEIKADEQKVEQKVGQRRAA